MPAITWLHLTDLHLGQEDQNILWPNVRDRFFRDLEKLHARTGSWDLVLFSGDLVQSGSPGQFEELDGVLEELWGEFDRLGCNPTLLTVPGNHDVSWPDELHPARRALRGWHSDTTLRKDFWTPRGREYRALVEEAFQPFTQWWKRRPESAELSLTPGLLPGDFSASLVIDGLRLGVVGLNTAFLQLGPGVKEGDLDLDLRQLHEVCARDPVRWTDAHDVRLLMTHHPPSWLHPSARSALAEDISPGDRFLVHFFGHMHEGTSRFSRVDGGPTKREVQGPALFGLEKWRDSGGEQHTRIHGYSAGEIRVEGEEGVLRFWPRRLNRTGGGEWEMHPDLRYSMDDDFAVTDHFRVNPRRRSGGAAEPSRHGPGQARLAREDRSGSEVVRPDDGPGPRPEPNAPGPLPASPLRKPAAGRRYFRDFDLRLFRDGLRGYCVEIVGQAAVRTSPEIMWPGEDVEARIAEIDDLVRQVRAGTADGAGSERLGRILFDAAFPRPVRLAWRQRQQLEELDSYLRLRLEIEDPWLATLPWELLHADAETNRDNFLGLSDRRPIVRRPERRNTSESEVPALPATGLRVLRVQSRAMRPGTGGHDLDASRVQVTVLSNPGPDAVRERMREAFHVLELEVCGSGTDGIHAPLLVLTASGGIPVEDLASALPDSARLLVLRPPPGSPSEEIDALPSAATALVRAGVPAVLTLQATLPDRVFGAFARSFYGHLADGHPVEDCAAQGRLAVLALGGSSPAWAMPALFSGVQDGMLWSAAAASGGGRRRPATAIPNNLPHRSTHRLLGRERELKQLLLALRPEAPQTIVNLYGREGAGRSALARAAARACIERQSEAPGSFEAVLWVSMLGLVPSGPDAFREAGQGGLGLGQLFMGIARTLGMPRLLGAPPEERVLELQHLLNENRYLLILDDIDRALDPERLHELIGDPPAGSRIILISRSPYGASRGPADRSASKDAGCAEPSYHDRHFLPVPAEGLDGLRVQDACELVERDAGQLPSRGLTRLVEAADRLPLLLRLAAGQLRDGGSLNDVTRDLQECGVGASPVDAFLRVSVDRLTDDEKVVLHAVALLPQAAHLELVAAAAGLERFEVTDALARLVDLQLVRSQEDEPGLPRYSVRSRIRRSAPALAASGSGEAVARRVVEYTLRESLKKENRESDAGCRRLRDEVGNVLWATRMAYQLGLWEQVISFREEAQDLLFGWGYWNEALQLGEWAFEAADCAPGLAPAKRLASRAWCALYPLARVYFYQGEHEAAKRWCMRAQALFTQSLEQAESIAAEEKAGKEEVEKKDAEKEEAVKEEAVKEEAVKEEAVKEEAVKEARHGLAAAARNLGRVLAAMGETERARVLFEEGLEHVRAIRDPSPRQQELNGHLLAALADVATSEERFREAKSLLVEARAIYAGIRAMDGTIRVDRAGVATTCYSLGMLLLREQGGETEAADRFQEGLNVLRGKNEWSERRARLHYGLAVVAERRNDLGLARSRLQTARSCIRSHVASDRYEAADLAGIEALWARLSRDFAGGTRSS